MNTPIILSVHHADTSLIFQVLDYQLVFVLDGTARICGMEDCILSSGMIALISPFYGNELVISANSSVICGKIDNGFFEDHMGIPQQSVTLVHDRDRQILAERIISLCDLSFNRETSSLNILGACIELLTSLEAVMPHVEVLNVGSRPTKISQMVLYIQEHFREPIQLSDLSDTFGVSRQHISTSIHRELGISFMEYLQKLRLGYALRLIITTESSISRICEESGFPNLKAFNQVFQRQYGMSPGAYRKAMKSDTKPNAPSAQLLHRMDQLLKPYRSSFLRGRTGIHLETVVPQEVTICPDNWRDILNVDNSVQCLHAEAQNAIRAIQNTMHFRYVRLGGLNCEEMLPYIQSQSRHRFTYFFQLIDFFRSIDLTPMLAFGNAYSVSQDYVMLRDGAYSVQHEDWLQTMHELMDASVRYWGKKWVSTWRIELHMPKELYGSEEPEQFVELFRTSAQVAQSYAPGIAVGGPAMMIDQEHKGRWNAWFRAVKSGRIRPDFISMELWAEQDRTYFPFKGQFGDEQTAYRVDMIRNADAEIAVNRVVQMHEAMESYCITDMPLYISAIGIVKHHAYPAQIGGHCSAHLVKCLTKLMGLADGVGCWKALNDEAEYVDEYHMISLGCGLYSRHQLCNPNWYAYSFLSQLLPKVAYQDDGCIVTTDGAENYSVLLNNCKNYSDYFCRNFRSDFAARFEDQRLYVNAVGVERTITFRACSAPSYLVKQYLIGDYHGCIASVLQQMGEPLPPTLGEIRYIDGQSLPYRYTYHVKAERQLQITVAVQPNEVMLLKITPEQNAHFENRTTDSSDSIRGTKGST